MKKIFAVLISFCLLLLSACASETSETASSKSAAAKVQTEASASSEVKEKKIYSDKLITMSFISVQDMPSLKGMFLLNIRAKNKSSKEITVYLQNASVNGKMIQMGSGTPCDIMPSKEAIHSFTGKDSVVEISSVNEIKEIEFKICVMDKSANVVETTKSITVNL